MSVPARTLATRQETYAVPPLHIAGRWREGRHSTRHPVFDPSTGKSIGSLGLASADDINDAIAAAEQGLDGYLQTKFVHRFSPAETRAEGPR